eukprot:scaffold1192_cov80-Skeletonema_marinoi.AAC.7
MSADDCEAGDMMTMMCCASCGIPEDDEIKLKECDDCDLVRYCSDACQKNHSPQHEEACKKRAAELRDELLFKQPESNHLGDCPICMIPMPLDESKSSLYSCCSKLICRGCDFANHISAQEKEEMPSNSCAFCREPLPATKEENDRNTMKRIEVNDPVTLRQWGYIRYSEGDYKGAFEYWTKAAKLGDAGAHYGLSHSYQEGKGGVEKDEKLELYHLEQAAIGGHPYARYNLGRHEWKNGNAERGMKHWIIAATQGYDGSIKKLMDEFRSGIVSKDDLAAALRAHQAAVDSAKSPQREAAEKYRRKMKSSK